MNFNKGREIDYMDYAKTLDARSVYCEYFVYVLLFICLLLALLKPRYMTVRPILFLWIGSIADIIDLRYVAWKLRRRLSNNEKNDIINKGRYNLKRGYAIVYNL